MENLPVYISIVFLLTTFLTAVFFYKASRNSKIVLMISLVWLTLQAIIASTGFYTITKTIPPRFLLLVSPPLILIIFMFVTDRGRNFIDRLDVKIFTLLHMVRIPVEFVLLWLFLNKVVPQIMTFEGRNFDIFSGLTAPLIYYFGFIKNRIDKKIMLLWNICCLMLLFNIVITAVLSAPFPFQKFAFDQPNIAILYFPFVWLPCFIVPVVLFSHLVSIRQIIIKPDRSKNNRIMT